MTRNDNGAAWLDEHLLLPKPRPMYHHVKKLMFTVRVDEPDVRFDANVDTVTMAYLANEQRKAA